MKRTGALTKSLAIGGTVLVWVPVIAPFVLTRWAEFGTGHFNFDWLIPAELFPAVLTGGLLLLAAALFARRRRRMVGWGLGLAFTLLVASQLIAEATGLASGATAPTGVPWALVVSGLVGYVVAVAGTGVAGALLVKDLFAADKPDGAGEPDEAR